MKKLFLTLLLGAAISRAQIPAPPIPLTSNLGSGGVFPLLNSGTLVFSSDANHTMVYPEMSASFIKVTSSVSLTATRNLVAPLTLGFAFTVENATTGGQSICVGGATGACVTIPNGTTTQVVSDGTNYLGAAARGALGTQYKAGCYTGAGSGSNTALGQCNWTTDATGNPLNVPGALTAPSIAAFDPTKPLNMAAIAAITLDFVQPGTSSNAIPQQNPYTKTQTISKRYQGNDQSIAQHLFQYALSGGKNFSAGFTGGASLVNEKPDYEVDTLVGEKQTEGQVGGVRTTWFNNLGVGDSVPHTDQIVATGCSDGDDECLKAWRADYSYDARRFGMTLTSVTADGIGNWILRGSALAGYTEVAAEGLPVIDLTGDLNPSSLGNITDMRAYPADTRFQQLTPDTGINIGTLLGNSTVSFSTSSIAPPVANAGIVTNYDGTGGLVNATQTVANASTYTASATIPVCLGSVADNFEITHIISVNVGTNTLTYDYIRNQHGTNEMVSQGGGCGYAVAMTADDKASGTANGTLSYGGDHGNNTTTLHNAYPVLATIGGDLITYSNSAVSGDAYLHTAAYVNTTPQVPGVLTLTVTSGAVSSLTVQAAADYTNSAAVFTNAGQHVLAYPTIIFSGGACTTQPTATVTGYQNLGGSGGGLNNPIISITNAGAGCNNTLAATMQSTGWTNPYHLYPMTMSFKVIDPTAAIDPNTNQHSAAGYFVRTEALNTAKWNVGDHIEIAGWWNQYTASNRTFGKIYGGQSNRSGVLVYDNFVGDFAGNDTLEGFFNGTPSSKYWSPQGPAPGRQYETPPDGYMPGGMLNHAFVMTDAPRTAILSVQCKISNGALDGLSPCHSNVAQQYNIWEGFTAANVNTLDTIFYNNGTRTIGFRTLNLDLGSSTISHTGLFNGNNVHFTGSGTVDNAWTVGDSIIMSGVSGDAYGRIKWGSKNQISLCSPYTGNALCDNPAGTPLDSPVHIAQGEHRFGTVSSSQSGTFNTVYSGLAPVAYYTASYSGAAGSTGWTIFLTKKSPDGFEGLATSYFVGISNAAATLSASNKITVTCPAALEFGDPAGTTYEAYDNNGTNYDIGPCSPGGTAVDTGVGTVKALPVDNANMPVYASKIIAREAGTIGFQTSRTNAALDTGLSKGAAGEVLAGNGTAGDHTGKFHAAHGVFDTDFGVGGSQLITGVQGTTGTKLLAATGAFTNGHLLTTDANGNAVDGGAAITQGSATLVAGTVTVSTASAVAAAGGHYELTNCGASGTSIGTPSIGTVTVGTSFVINSLTATNTVATGDTSTVCWWIR